MRLVQMGFVAMAVAAAMGACGGDGNRLPGTTWTLATLDGGVVLPQAEAWIRFDDAGRFSGSTGCNSVSGTWSSSGSEISFSEISTTLIGCPGPVGEQERTFNAALDAARTYEVGAGALMLMDESGSVRAMFKERANATPAVTP